MTKRRKESIHFFIYSKYKFKCLLTKDPSETSSLEYIISKNYTVSFFYYTDICLTD